MTGYFGSGASPSCSPGKRKRCDSSSPFSAVHLGDQDGWTEEKDCCLKETKGLTCSFFCFERLMVALHKIVVVFKNKFTHQTEMPQLFPSFLHYQFVITAGQETVIKNSTVIISENSNAKELTADSPKAPQKPRTGYHIFLRLETHRLRNVLGEGSNSQNLREMAVSAWRSLPEKDKLVIHHFMMILQYALLLLHQPFLIENSAILVFHCSRISRPVRWTGKDTRRRWLPISRRV